jgi:hypothetical protein
LRLATASILAACIHHRAMEVPLEDWAQLDRAGRYELSASLRWDAASVEAPSVTFSLAQPKIEAATLAIDVGAPNSNQIRVLLRQRVSSEVSLWESVFSQDEPNPEALVSHSTRQLDGVGPDGVEPLTEEIFSPWSNFDRMVGLHHWHGWRQGNTLFARPILGETTQSLDLAAAAASGIDGLLHPTLMPESGELDVFFLSAGSREVGMARFSAASMDGATGAPELLWTTPAPGRILAGGGRPSPSVSR